MPSLLAISMIAALGVSAPRYKGSDAESTDRSRGFVALKEINIDLDGRGPPEVAVALKGPSREMFVAVFAQIGDPDEGELQLLAKSTPRRADRLVRLEALRLLGRRPMDLIAVFEEKAPDETLHHVRVLAGLEKGVVEVFARSFHVTDRSPKDAVSFGDASPKVSVSDVDDEEDGPLELLWTREPEVLELQGREAPVKVVIGAVKTVFRYDPAGHRFVEEEAPLVEDFLVPKTPWEVEASDQVAKIWGTAQPFWGADGDLETSWNVAGKKGGRGESLTLRFKRSEEITFLRVVPGCARNADDWAIHDRVSAFRIELSSGPRFDIDVDSLDELPAAVRAAGEFPIEVDYGSQVLLLLSQPQSVRWARFTITKVKPSRAPRGRRVRETCLSEISFH